MILKFKSSDCPNANGRTPQFGEQKWTLTFPLENGDDYLELEIGSKGREGIRQMLIQEEKDDAADEIKMLKKIAAHVPASIWIKAKEKAGFGELIVPK